MRVVLFAALALAIPVLSSAQQARVQKFTAPLSGQVNLSEVEDRYNAQVVSLEAPAPDGNVEKARLRAIKQQSAQLFPRKRSDAAYKTSTAAKPIVGISYVADSFPGIPPDNYLAVSKGNKSISVINSSIAAHDAVSGTMNFRKSLKLFSISVGLNSVITDHRYDPKVIYDPEYDRFICVMLNGTNAANWIIVAFSQSNDPAGMWNFYKFYGDYDSDTTWFDYPAISVTKDEFYLTGNKIKFNTSWQLGFSQSVIYQFDKQQGYNGDANLSYQIWDNISYNGRPIRNLFPVKGGGGIKGPEQYFLSNRNFDVQNDTFFLIKVPDTLGSANTNLTITPLVSNLTYGVPPEGRQPDTSVTLATNDARVLGAFVEGNEIQFVNTTVDPVSGSSGVYHGIISDYATTPAVQGSYFIVDTLDFGYPNLSYSGDFNGKNTSIISFNYTGPNTFPGMAAIYFDGTQHSDLVQVKTGMNSVDQLPGKSQRWGDYMGSQPDWNAIGSVWIEGIFGRMDQEYGNYIARLTSPNATHVAGPEQKKSPALAFPNPAFNYIRLEFELQHESVLQFVIYDAAGRKVDEVLNQFCKRGKNRIQFNTATLPEGLYLLKAFDTKGKEAFTSRFVKQ